MSNSKILEGKRAVVFGAGGSVGAAVAKEFAAEGAEVYLSGRNKASVDEVKAAIESAGGKAAASVLDALDDGAVARYVEQVASKAGGIDIEFNAVAPNPREYGNGKPAIDVSIDEYMVALSTVLKSRIITAKNAARQMIKQGSGVIIGITGSTARGHIAGGTSLGIAFGAIETLMENLAFEVSPKGVRVVCLRMTANVDSNAIRNTARAMKLSEEQFSTMLANLNFLKTPAKIADTAKAAAMIASDRFRLLTGTVVNSSAGAALD
jgi:3-oxoacyl-[acyl-carrier protein] reductase